MDEREIEATRAEREAAIWLARLHADDRRSEDEHGYHAWRLSDLANAEAFDHLTEMWEVAAGTRRAPYFGKPVLPRAVGRRAILTGVCLAAVTAGSLGFYQSAYAGVYETAVGEQKHLALSDGSALLLDTDSKVRVRMSGSARRVELLRGRCNFRVAPRPGDSFIVDGGTTPLRIDYGDIDVRRWAEGLEVTCFAGRARLEDASAPSLHPGQRIALSPGARPRIDTPDLQASGSWQSGQLIFDDQILGDAIEELNRYSYVKLVADRRTATLRVSGVYRVGDNAAFARAVARLLQIHATPGDGKILLTAA